MIKIRRMAKRQNGFARLTNVTQFAKSWHFEGVAPSARTSFVFADETPVASRKSLTRDHFDHESNCKV